MATAVGDSSVLIHLGAIGQLELLPALYQLVIVPDAVWREVVLQGKSRPVVQQVRQAVSSGWLRVATPKNAALLQVLHQQLHDGEAEAIVLATEVMPDSLLMDETDGREFARRLGLKTRGAVGLLMEAKRLGHIAAIRPWLERLDQSGFHLAPVFITQVLQQAGE